MWWNASGAWQASVVEHTMSTVDATNRPGQYQYVFAPQITDFMVTYRARVTAGAGSPANGPWYGSAVWGEWVDDLNTVETTSSGVQTILKRIGGEVIETQLRSMTGLLDAIRQKLGV